MDIKVLDIDYQLVGIIDTYKSFIWTERYREAGDFELVVPINYSSYDYIRNDNYLSIDGSDRLMIIEAIETVTDLDEGNTLKLTGRSLESIISRRIIWDYGMYTGTFQDAMQRILNANIISPSNQERTIPNFFFDKSDDATITAITMNDELYGENVYEVVVKKCAANNIGFKVIPDYDTTPGGFRMSFYNGVDRSYKQDDRPWVVFSAKMENLVNTQYSESRLNLKTVVLTTASGNSPTRRRLEVKSETHEFTGLSRREEFLNSSVTENQINISDFGEPEDRVNYNKYYTTGSSFNQKAYNKAKDNGLLVTEDDYTTTWVIKPEDNPAYEQALANAAAQIQAEYQAAVEAETARVNAALKEEGKTELSNNDISRVFDGSMNIYIQYVLGVDYNLGDIVQVVTDYGYEAYSRVIELIHSYDEDGENFYPSFESL